MKTHCPEAITNPISSSLPKRKTARPFDRKQALHGVLSSSRARGRRSMLSPPHARHVHDLTHELAREGGIRLFRFANVGSHVHLLIQAPSRAAFQRFFLRELAGTLAIVITGARKGSALRPNESGRRLWDRLAFTRIVSWGRDLQGVLRTLVKNLFEAMGIPMKKFRHPRKHWIDTGSIQLLSSCYGESQQYSPGWSNL